MNCNDYIDLQMVIIMISCVLMLAVLAIEQGSFVIRLLIFSASFCNLIAACLFIRRERRLLNQKNQENVAGKAA